MFQPVTTLPIPKSAVQKLIDGGFHDYEDVLGNAHRFKDVVVATEKSKVELKTALELLRAEQNRDSIPTMSQSLDAALGFGIKLGSLTEVCGLPGSGKTQLCLQLCTAVQIPKHYGGLGGEAAYIDTACNFNISRLKDMATACAKQLGADFDWCDEVLNGVHFLEAFGTDKFCASIALLVELIEKNRNIKLIIIDSIAFPFKHDCTSIERTGILYRTAARLRQIAANHNLAVVLTNEMSTRIGIGTVGAMGDAWAHCVGTRIIMATPNVAVTHISDRADSIAKIKITKDGIRDK